MPPQAPPQQPIRITSTSAVNGTVTRCARVIGTGTAPTGNTLWVGVHSLDIGKYYITRMVSPPSSGSAWIVPSLNIGGPSAADNISYEIIAAFAPDGSTTRLMGNPNQSYNDSDLSALSVNIQDRVLVKRTSTACTP